MKHIIWDFNGTLLNDAQLSVDLDNDVFDQIGVPRITLEDYRNNMTMPVRDFYPRVGVDYAKHSYEEIARLCGMDDASYFNKVFKKMEGCTASEYRKQW